MVLQFSIYFFSFQEWKPTNIPRNSRSSEAVLISIMAHCGVWDLNYDVARGVQSFDFSWLLATDSMKPLNCNVSCSVLTNLGLIGTDTKCFSSTQHHSCEFCVASDICRWISSGIFWHICCIGCRAFVSAQTLCAFVYKYDRSMSVCLLTVAVVNATVSGFCILM